MGVIKDLVFPARCPMCAGNRLVLKKGFSYMREGLHGAVTFIRNALRSFHLSMRTTVKNAALRLSME